MNTPETVKEACDRITREWADRGLIMEGGWQAFLAHGMPKEAGDLQKSEMRKAYYLGAQHLFASVMSILDPGTEPTEKDLERMTSLHKELELFIESYKGSHP